jgi:hypothetical protein
MLSATITRPVTFRQFAAAALAAGAVLAAATLAGCALDTSGAAADQQAVLGAEAGGSVAAVLRLVR